MAEALIDKIARTIGSDPLSVRKRNLYGPTTGTTTPYGMEVEHNLLPEMINELEQSAQYWQRREAISAFQPRKPGYKERPCAYTGQIRYFLYSETPQSSRRAGSYLHRR